MICRKPTKKIDSLTPQRLCLGDFSEGKGEDIRVTLSKEQQAIIEAEAGARIVVFHSAGDVPICQNVNSVLISNVQSVEGRNLHDIVFDGPTMTAAKNASSSNALEQTLHVYIQQMGETGPSARWYALAAIDHHKN
jgi:hypothetical protein